MGRDGFRVAGVDPLEEPGGPFVLMGGAKDIGVEEGCDVSWPGQRQAEDLVLLKPGELLPDIHEFIAGEMRVRVSHEGEMAQDKAIVQSFL